jgi:pimeloyl-ACP methyl ester carboxylesterase
MVSYVSTEFPTTGPTPCAQAIRSAGNYDQAVGFDYDWTQTPSTMAPQLATFINSLSASWVDIEAHSYGAVIALAALPKITAPVKNVILLAWISTRLNSPNTA